MLIRRLGWFLRSNVEELDTGSHPLQHSTAQEKCQTWTWLVVLGNVENLTP
jgi:hypothetical protein